MLETQEDIDFALETSGEVLEFCCGNMKAVPGSDMYLVQNAANDAEVQQYIFMTSDINSIKFDLRPKVEFTYRHPLLAKVYRFKIDTLLRDITGWVSMNCSYIGIEDV